ncbi:MAG: GrpB family protein, partial [Chloroflexota bacterium]|nr:GrpB family protein [Chloroflexota bacterium]
TVPIEIADHHPEWPRLFALEAAAIQAALGAKALQIHHTGSTSVPGLAAKPRIDIVLVVPNSADEPAYVPALEAAGFILRIREPEWFEHRVFKGPRFDLNLHVFSEGCSEIDRMLLFRDWLRSNTADRQLYEDTKRALAAETWGHVQEYADAKTEVIDQIIARATAATPHPQR